MEYCCDTRAGCFQSTRLLLTCIIFSTVKLDQKWRIWAGNPESTRLNLSFIIFARVKLDVCTSLILTSQIRSSRLAHYYKVGKVCIIWKSNYTSGHRHAKVYVGEDDETRVQNVRDQPDWSLGPSVDRCYSDFRLCNFGAVGIRISMLSAKGLV